MHFPFTKINFSIYPFPSIIKNLHFPLGKAWARRRGLLLLSVWLEKNWLFHIVIMLLYAQKLVFAYSYTLWAPCQWPCCLRWRLVALASWAVFADSYTLWAWNEVGLGSFWDHFCVWHHFGISWRSIRDHFGNILGSVRVSACCWNLG